MLADKLRSWLLVVAPLITVVLVLIQMGTSYYWDKQSEEYVKAISGVQASELYELDGQYLIDIEWDTSFPPHSCPVSLGFVWLSPSGVAYLEDPVVLDLTVEEHHAAVKARLLGPSPELVGSPIATVMMGEPGEWRYYIDFSFHCSVVKGNAVADVVNFDSTYTAAPVVIHIK